METTIYGVFGASGFGREVMPLVRDYVAKNDPQAECFFIDDKPPSDSLNGCRCLTFDAFISHQSPNKKVTLAIANSAARETLTKRCIEAGIQFFDVHADNVVRFDSIEIGVGAILSHFVILTSNIRIGQQFQANVYSYVGHDCVIGDYVTFAPAVKCNGNVVIEDHAYIGAGAILKQGQPGQPLVIGKGAVIGMGAVVTKSVAAGITVVGNPAKPLVS